MDTRAPPICPRQQDNRCQQTSKSKQQEVTLPPLDPYPTQRHRNKQSCWRSTSAAPPGLLRQNEIQRRRPYRVLALGATPLMHACQQGDRHRVLKLLREQEETVGYRDRALRSALHYCMDAGTGGAVAQAAPELVDSPDADGHTALHLAVIGGDSQLVAVLLANGANVNALDLQAHSVLHWAVVCGEVECVRLVLAAGARPSIADHRGGTALHYAAQCCGAPASSELAVPKKSGLAVLHALLEYGADVHARDEDGRQPVLWAASAGSPDAILALVRVGGSAVAGSSDKDGLTALHCAASRGHARCIETLVNLCDAQPDHVDDNGCSALHYAATLGHADATSLLLRLGADPNRQDRKGRTPALCAAAKGQLETLKILAQHGGSLHARTIRGTGLAHEAVASGRLELVRWLARRRPGLLDVATPDGRTPLHVAALHGHLDVCKLLLDSGARVNALLRTSKGTLMTALDAALYRGHRDAAKLVQMHGGLTAQHIAARKPGHNRVFAAKLRARPSETSSDDSERRPSGAADHNHRNDKSTNGCERSAARATRTARGQQQQDSREPGSADVYYEERWVERRTRRRAKARRLTRHDSRSFSEEELRRGAEIASTRPPRDKSAKQDQQQREQQPEHKRALSEGAGRRLDDDGTTGSRSRRRDEAQSEGKPGEGSESRSEAASTRSDDDRNFDAEEEEEASSVSDDSLEIVVVRRSLEKTSERIVSGRTRTRSHLEASSSKDTAKGSSKSKRSSRRDTALSKQRQREAKDASEDTASQEQQVERVTVTADVHEHRQSKDSPREAGIPEAPTPRSKIDEMLEKADELQSALASKAADLRKDMEQMRLQEAKAAGPDNSSEVTGSETSAASSAREEVTGKAESKENNEEQAKETEKTEAEKLEKDETVGQGGSSQETTQRQRTVILVTDETDETSRVDVDEPGDGGKDEREQVANATTTTTTTMTRKGSKEEDRTNEQATTQADVQGDVDGTQTETSIPGTEGLRYVDESSSSSPRPGRRPSRPSTAKQQQQQQQQKRRGSKTAALFESSEDASPDRSAIVAVIESPEWDEDEEDELDKEIRRAVGEHDEDEEEDDGGDESEADPGIVRVLPSTSDDELPARTSTLEALPQLQHHNKRVSLRRNSRHQQQQQQLQEVEGNNGGVVGVRLRRDSNGRDSGIEPSPRVHQSRIPRRSARCCPNSERQQALNMDTVTRDLQISMRRYHLERKIFFQLMELKRLQIRHGRSNENVLIKRQVDSFHKAGMSGPALGVARYDQPFTFRHFEAFLYEQLRRLQRRSATPDWCTEAKQCTQKTHRCHHATSAYTSVPIYTYLGGGGQERSNYLPNIEGRGKGQMTVKLTHGQEKQIIALPTEKLDRTKRYYVTFTVRGDTTDSEKPKTPTDSPAKRQPKNT